MINPSGQGNKKNSNSNNNDDCGSSHHKNNNRNSRSTKGGRRRRRRKSITKTRERDTKSKNKNHHRRRHSFEGETTSIRLSVAPKTSCSCGGGAALLSLFVGAATVFGESLFSSLRCHYNLPLGPLGSYGTGGGMMQLSCLPLFVATLLIRLPLLPNKIFCRTRLDQPLRSTKETMLGAPFLVSNGAGVHQQESGSDCDSACWFRGVGDMVKGARNKNQRAESATLRERLGVTN